MPFVTLRKVRDTESPEDLIVVVKENTFDYLRTSGADKIRVSAYLDREWANVEAEYAELFLGENSVVKYVINYITPGSRVRKGIVLPGPMAEGEQLVVEVERDGPAPIDEPEETDDGDEDEEEEID